MSRIVDVSPPRREAGRVPETWRRHFVDQDHSAYSATEHRVWRDVLARNEEIVAHCGKWLHPAYVEGMRALDLPRRVPRIEEINERLGPTGWRIACVDGYIPTSAYVGLMSARIFPVSRAIRRPEHIDFAPAPDMVHDILGHLPMLFAPEHREFLRRLAAVMARATSNPLDGEFYEAVRRTAELKADPASHPTEVAESEARLHRVLDDLKENASELTHLRRMYVWSIEFGLIGDEAKFWVYGAALLSSPSEFRSVCSGGPELIVYSGDVIRHENAFSDMLPAYFVARDFAHLHDVLTEFEEGMKHRQGVPRRSDIREVLPPTHERRSRHA